MLGKPFQSVLVQEEPPEARPRRSRETGVLGIADKIHRQASSLGVLTPTGGTLLLCPDAVRSVSSAVTACWTLGARS